MYSSMGSEDEVALNHQLDSKMDKCSIYAPTSDRTPIAPRFKEDLHCRLLLDQSYPLYGSFICLWWSSCSSALKILLARALDPQLLGATTVSQNLSK